ncbi:hypothetical protein FB451DRAFT_1319056, partial [Mycena latifolia]
PAPKAQYTGDVGPLRADWLAGCDRGEHDHLSTMISLGPLSCGHHPQPQLPLWTSSASSSRPSPSSPSSPTTPSSLTMSPPHSPSRSSRRTSRKSAPDPPLPSTAAPPGIAGKMAYAVKHSGGGVVFDDYGCARDLYHMLQAQGESPSLASCPSLTEGVCFAEGFSLEQASGAWRRWIEEEHAARRRNVAESWATGLSNWGQKRDGVWTSGSDDESDG